MMLAQCFYRQRLCWSGAWIAWASLFCVMPSTCRSDEGVEAPYGLDVRVPWTNNHLVGSPEPPLPYVAIKTFANITWDRPLYVKQEPGSNRLVVVQQGGEADKPATIWRVEDRSDANETSLFVELPGRLIYGLEFHPQYVENGFVYVFSNGPTGQPERKNRISRFSVSREASSGIPEKPVCDLNSEQLIIEWRSMGHDGGDLCFGHDGMLYVTSGDGTSDSDNWISAQDVSNLLGGVLRIDVDQPSADKAYSIPDDNPFVHLPNARGELWAIGLRNPWRMSIDAVTGQIWVGNNGQDLWETAQLLGRGENYGWSVYEGSHPFYAQRELGPGTLTRPTFEHHHSEARSLTGGVVYYGERLPELQGAYIYGDYSTGKIWAARHDGKQVVWHREIADTTLQIAGFSNTHHGDLLIVDHVGGIYRLEPNPEVARDSSSAFPTKLSQTGLFESVPAHRVQPGVIPYSVISPGWNDGAEAERFLAVPIDQQIEYTSDRGWNFPDGSVLVQTLSIDVGPDLHRTKRRIETRLLVRQHGEWSGYSYQWNSDQDEATLVERDGCDIEIEGVSDLDGKGRQNWRIPSRAECMSCHSRAVGYVLGMTEVQMNRTHDYGQVHDNQLRAFGHIGLFTKPIAQPVDELKSLVDPRDASKDLEMRVKAYLHTNCSGCHVQAGGGNARMELEFKTPLEMMQIVSHFPQHDSFGILQPRIVAPGKPEESVMLARLSRRGRGQMPPLVSNRIDEQAVALMTQWIAALEPDRKFVREWTVENVDEHLSKLTSGRSFERGQTLFRETGCGQCHRLQNEFAGIGPNLTGLAKRLKPSEIVSAIIAPSANIAEQFATTLIATSDGEIVQGRVEAETDDVIVLRGRESFAAPRTIAKADIEQRALSKVSMMPEDTLNHLELDEILDLLAYIIADADATHAVYSE